MKRIEHVSNKNYRSKCSPHSVWNAVNYFVLNTKGCDKAMFPVNLHGDSEWHCRLNIRNLALCIIIYIFLVTKKQKGQNKTGKKEGRTKTRNRDAELQRVYFGNYYEKIFSLVFWNNIKRKSFSNKPSSDKYASMFWAKTAILNDLLFCPVATTLHGTRKWLLSLQHKH
jgi:hypothetical protein